MRAGVETHLPKWVAVGAAENPPRNPGGNDPSQVAGTGEPRPPLGSEGSGVQPLPDEELGQDSCETLFCYTPYGGLVLVHGSFCAFKRRARTGSDV
ncbi:hypothetical protein DRP04_00110 [Archaeoglobales archaeon]|nr:MAG: hypothetical protein DRP04_00110 [Archaeoglobales archaeon]